MHTYARIAQFQDDEPKPRSPIRGVLMAETNVCLCAFYTSMWMWLWYACHHSRSSTYLSMTRGNSTYKTLGVCKFVFLRRVIYLNVFFCYLLDWNIMIMPSSPLYVWKRFLCKIIWRPTAELFWRLQSPISRFNIFSVTNNAVHEHFFFILKLPSNYFDIFLRVNVSVSFSFVIPFSNTISEARH